MRRVVVTGLGMVTPLACGVEATWRRLVAGESAAAQVENFDVSDLPCQIAAQVPRGADPDAFHPDDWMDPKEQRRVDDFIIYGVSAATQALTDAGWAPETYEEEIETGVLIGSGIGGLGGIADAAMTLHEKGPRRISPFFIPGRLINLVSGQVSIAHYLKGPEPLRRHRLLDWRACDRRRRAADRARRRRCYGGRRRGIGGQPPFARRLLPPAARSPPDLTTGRTGLASLRSRSRRLRDGRGRRLRRARRARACQARAAPASTPNLIGYGLSGDAFTLPPRPRMATARFAA